MSIVRVLGHDPGIRVSGHAVLECDESVKGWPISVVTMGGYEPHPSGPRTTTAKAKLIAHHLVQLAEKYSVDAAVVEDWTPWGAVRGNSWKTAVAMGAAVGALTARGLPVYELLPAELRGALFGRPATHAEKVHLHARVEQILRGEFTWMLEERVLRRYRVHAKDAATLALVGMWEVLGRRAKERAVKPSNRSATR